MGETYYNKLSLTAFLSCGVHQSISCDVSDDERSGHDDGGHVWCLHTFQQIHVVDVLTACSFYLPVGKEPINCYADHNLE